MTHIDKTQSKNKSSFIVLNDTLDVGDNSYRCLEVPIDGDFFYFGEGHKPCVLQLGGRYLLHTTKF